MIAATNKKKIIVNILLSNYDKQIDGIINDLNDVAKQVTYRGLRSNFIQKIRRVKAENQLDNLWKNLIDISHKKSRPGTSTNTASFSIDSSPEPSREPSRAASRETSREPSARLSDSRQSTSDLVHGNLYTESIPSSTARSSNSTQSSRRN